MGTYGYSWEYLEDEREGLTDQAIEPTATLRACSALECEIA